jgi:uracil-DNA glycosylase
MVMDENKTWLLDQLNGHLEFMQELGIDTINPAVLNCLEVPPPASFAPALAGQPSVSPGQPRPETAATPNTLLEPPPPMKKDNTQPRFSSLEAIREDLGDCRRCKLCRERTNIVFGSGNPHPQLVFVGEGPGADEDAQGLPFVGKAGQLLTKIIESIQLKREEVYICNVVKCRPPGNRVPEPDEVTACSPFLLGQLEVLRPRIICCLGATAAQTMLNTQSAMGKLRGRFYDYHGVQLIATYHPAYLLRNPAAKREVWEDMKLIRARLMNTE